MFTPLFRMLGPPAFGRFLLEITPSVDLQRIKETVDVMSDTSNAIYQDKLLSLRNGDQKLLEQMGARKDIMSILRECINQTSG